MACHPTRLLRDEHRLILQVLDVLETLLSAGRHDASREDLRECVDFFRLFADACHHGKEEDLLFETLVEGGMPRHQGPIAMMLQEHELGRLRVKEMSEALDSLQEDHTSAWPDLMRAGTAYIDLLRHHILKEDGALFAMADEAVDGPACRALCEAYENACTRRFEGRTLDQLRDTAHRLREKYRVP